MPSPTLALARPVALAALGAAACLLLGACACSPTPGRYNVEVGVDPAWRESESGVNKSVTVDLVGVAPGNADRWSSVSMDTYADSQLRRDFASSIRSFGFTPTDTSAKTLERTDAIWDTWLERGATRLFVLADIPGAEGSGGAKGANAQRLILPLSKCCWEAATIRLQLKEGSIVAATPQVPDCPK